ncbi:hypothetical protein ABIB85_007922 [Bradyrhizobium sp. JR1.5]
MRSAHNQLTLKRPARPWIGALRSPRPERSRASEGRGYCPRARIGYAKAESVANRGAIWLFPPNYRAPKRPPSYPHHTTISYLTRQFREYFPRVHREMGRRQELEGRSIEIRRRMQNIGAPFIPVICATERFNVVWDAIAISRDRLASAGTNRRRPLCCDGRCSMTNCAQRCACASSSRRANSHCCVPKPQTSSWRLGEASMPISTLTFRADSVHD